MQDPGAGVGPAGQLEVPSTRRTGQRCDPTASYEEGADLFLDVALLVAGRGVGLRAMS